MWRTAVVMGAILFLLWQVFTGWKRGPVRQLCSVFALVAAYAAAFFGGRASVPYLRGFFELPDILLMVLGGAVLGLLAFIAVSVAGGILFRKTADQESGLVRFGYGVSGSLLGLLFGLLMLWAFLLVFRLVGTVAEARLDEEKILREDGEVVEAESPPQIIQMLAEFKKTTDEGQIGEVVEKMDVIPDEVHAMLSGVTRIAANPRNAQRFLEFPGARTLAEHPRIVALGNDPDIQEELRGGGYMNLLSNRKIIDAANDPELGELLKKFELENAIEYALGENRQR